MGRVSFVPRLLRLLAARRYAAGQIVRWREVQFWLAHERERPLARAALDDLSSAGLLVPVEPPGTWMLTAEAVELLKKS